MAGEMFFKMLGSLRGMKERSKYLRMEADEEVGEHGLRALAPSFRTPVDHTGARVFERWANFSIEEEYTSTGLFSPARSPVQENAGFSNRLKRMCTRFPLRDMSFLVGFSFAIGSAIFVVNGFFLLLPILAPSTNFATAVPYATPASSVIGAVIFVIGGWLAVLEGLNLKRGGEVTVIEEVVLEEGDEMIETQPKTYLQEPLLEEKYTGSNSTPNHSSSSQQHQTHTEQIQVTTPKPALLGSENFIHWLTWQQFCDTYRYDLVWLGGMIQFIGTLIFAMASFTAVPGVLDSENTLQVRLLNLLPATAGGVLFTIAAIFQLIVTQKKWWLPVPQRTEWWIGAWNTIGSIGFTLAGALPFIQGSEEAAFWAVMADLVGSAAFMAGSAVQWFVVMGNYP